jgi:two-component system, OmpR family, response regulator ResD
LLDVMLPELDGWTVCREIRKQSKVPVVMLTARSEDFDEVHGLEIGADDYVKKPVKPTTLIARINALFRRTERDNNKLVMSYNGLEIDDSSHVVKIDGHEIALSPKEYTLLVILVENNGKVISREQLLNQVWGYNYYGGLRTVDTHINRLRMKLLNKGDCIHTIRGFGYKFEG